MVMMMLVTIFDFALTWFLTVRKTYLDLCLADVDTKNAPKPLAVVGTTKF